MKRLLCAVLAVAVLFSLCACGQETASSETATTASETTTQSADSTSTATQSTTAADPSSISSQIALLYSNIGILSSSEYQNFWYTITDLDHNGRIEIIAAITEGTDSVTRAMMYEVNTSYDGLTAVNMSSQYLPEIITTTADTYNVSGTYSYIFKDNSAVGTEAHYLTLDAVSLSNGTLTVTPLAYKDVTYINGNTIYTFSDKDGNQIEVTSDAEFDKLADNSFAGATKTTTNFNWFALSEVSSADRLTTSYSAFTGEQVVAPSATPQVIYTPAPTIYVVEVVPTVLKDPTSETIYEGGTCTFIAQADSYQRVAWSFVDTSGNTYSYAPYSQLGVSGLTSPQLTLSNVPIAMNGWSVYATFYSTAGQKSTSAAKIYVNAAPVVVKTVTASPSSGYYTSNYTWITLYSSTGENIHYEAYRQGDSGAYDSSTVSSGSGFSLVGIDGQSMNIEVYANVVGSDKTSYFVYTVDLVPAPTPSETKYGTVLSCDGQYATIQFSDGTCDTYYIEYMCSNPPVEGVSITCTFEYGSLVAISFDNGD